MNVSQFTGFISWYLKRLAGIIHPDGSRKIFYERVIYDHTGYPGYLIPEEARKKLLSGAGSGLLTDVNTHGALSSEGSVKRTVASVVRRSAVTPSQGRLLFRICRHYNVAKVFELGTSAGISTMYLALGNPSADVITVEGNSALADKAAGNFTDFKINNIQVLNSDFRGALYRLKKLGEFEKEGVKLAFIDGDHSYKPVIEYYEFLKDIMKPPYILIFHDIYWSKSMKKAWGEIAGTYNTSDILDLFTMGIVFKGL